MNNNFEIKTTRLHFVSIHELGFGFKEMRMKVLPQKLHRHASNTLQKKN